MAFSFPTVSGGTGTLIPAGLYTVRLKSIEEVESKSTQYGDSIRAKWIFEIEEVIDGDDEVVGQELHEWSSILMTPRSKMYQWVEALSGRSFAIGETPNPADVIGKRARATVVENTERPKRDDGQYWTKVSALTPIRKKKVAKTEDDELF